PFPFSLYALFSGHTKGTSARRIRLARLMVQQTIYGHPLQRTIATGTHGERQEFVSFPWSQEDRRRGSKPPVHSLLDQLQAGRAVAVSRRPCPQPFAPHFSWESSDHALPLPRVPRVHPFRTRSRTGNRERRSSGSDAGSS